VQSLLAHCVATANHWVPGDSGIPGQGEADRPANLAGDASGSTVLEQQFTLAANRARGISKRRWAAKAEWEADKCSKHFSYRLKGKAGTKRPILITSVKPLATSFYRPKSGHGATGVYLKRFCHRHDDKCCCCGGLCSRRGSTFPPLPQMEGPAEDTLEEGGTGNRLESGQMPARADL